MVYVNADSSSTAISKFDDSFSAEGIIKNVETVKNRLT